MGVHTDGLAGQALAGIAFGLAYFGLPGWIALRGKSLSCAPALGVCIAGPAALAAATLFGLGLPVLLLGWLAALAVALAVGRGRAWVRPRGWGLMGAAAAGAVLVAIDLLPVVRGEGLYLMPEMFDHAKLATIDAIAREGLPVRNPYYSPGGVPVPLNYYWGAHFCAALARVALGIHGWAAATAMTWYAAFAFLALSCGIAERWGGPRAAWWTLALGMLSVPVVFLAAGARAPYLMEPEWAFYEAIAVAPFYAQAPWVFQHVLGAAGAGVAIWALLHHVAGEWGPARTAAVVGFGLAMCVSCSAQIAVATAVCAPLVLAAARGRGAVPALGGTALALLLAWPILTTMIAGRPAGGRDLVEFRLFPASRLGRPLDPLLYWVQFLPLRLGVGFVAGMFALSRRWRLLEWRMVLVAVVGALLLAQVTKSVVLNNDLAWRAMLPAMLLLNPAAAVWRTRAKSIAARSLFAVGVFAGAMSTLGHVYRLSETPWESPERAELARGFAHQPAAWAAVRRHTGPTDLVANNPDGYAGMCWWRTNYSWALFADRPAAIADREIAWTNSLAQDTAQLEDALALVRTLFQEPQRAEEAARLVRGKLRVAALLLDRRDPVWPGDAIERSGAWTPVEATAHFKVYVPGARPVR